MSTIEDGGPAFPHTDMMQPLEHAAIAGMSLRDWFAGKETLQDVECNSLYIGEEAKEALAGRARPEDGSGELAFWKWNAEWRAALKHLRADAMLAARKTKP